MRTVNIIDLLKLVQIFFHACGSFGMASKSSSRCLRSEYCRYFLSIPVMLEKPMLHI